ncbi:hypothetical protein BFR57_05580 [Idiomarina sp. MD25a]|uniref:gluconeogenesis factor YvcK family protein n=1 Tax=Idiomarina sp. MD25a TaxID=1889913 RepID=UPI0008F82B1A|nr:uridine diphosphate-N-acetylglucosamine-binding protein YvcK [Idiomarina sp. MD25a]OIN01466.1 hypothetical protein BFR57_05580 [Idiomarina sp. MD25a]
MQLSTLKRVTAIGGGHGLGRVLSSLRFLKHRLVGVVTTTDNGGATGLLRQSHDCIAWGDIRNCLSQLVEQPLAAQVLNYRFSGDDPLAGHNFGNLLLHTLDQVSARPSDGIHLLSRLLNVDTRLLPMSECPTDLIALTHDDIECHGEILIDNLPHLPRSLKLTNDAIATPEVLQHIKKSELVILGPGSFLTSVLPPLLVPKIGAALASTKARVVFIDNLVHEKGPAGTMSVGDKLKFIEQHVGAPIIDAVLTNFADTSVSIPQLGELKSDHEVHYRHDTHVLLTQLEQLLGQLKTAA